MAGQNLTLAVNPKHDQSSFVRGEFCDMVSDIISQWDVEEVEEVRVETVCWGRETVKGVVEALRR